MVPRKMDNFGLKLIDIIARAAEFICKESQYGSWGDVRTSAMCIWALCNCGLVQTHSKFIKYCIAQLLKSDQCKRDDEGISFNLDAWDTSLVLITILESENYREFREVAKGLRAWLWYEFSTEENSVHEDPWDTLYAIRALQLSRIGNRAIFSRIGNSIAWTLDLQNKKKGGVIAPHYTGLMLPVLNHALTNMKLTINDQRLYKRAIRDSLEYIVNEFRIRKRKDLLWSDEPWSIGHVLQGIASSYKVEEKLFRNKKFNQFLVDWCEKGWNFSNGWTDPYDTANLLLGLSEYVVKREICLNRANEALLMKDIASRVLFQFRDPGVTGMRVYPIWKNRNFGKARKSCCVLMPYTKPWSDDIKDILEKLLKRHQYTFVRVDMMHGQEIMEDVWRAINESRIIIADITGRNVNVFYELGIAHTLGKDIILIGQGKYKKIPFDIQTHRIIWYELETAKQTLEKHLPRIIEEVKLGTV